MADSSPTSTHEEIARLERNRGRFVAALAPHARANTRRYGIELERFVCDVERKNTAPARGAGNTFEVLAEMRDLFERCEAIYYDDKFIAYTGYVTCGNEEVWIAGSVEPAGQLEVSVGPTENLAALIEAIQKFDAAFEAATTRLGLPYTLVAEAYDPYATDPAEVELIDKVSVRLLNEYLSRVDSSGSEMIKCTCATQVSVDYTSEADMRALNRALTALSPVLAFGCDNTRHWQGREGSDAPRMIRSQIYRHVDCDRCGIVPASLGDSFGFADYVAWLEQIRPIHFPDACGVAQTTGDLTNREIMAARDLTDAEVEHVLAMCYPDIRLKGYAEVRAADALPTAYVGAYAALIKGLTATDAALEQVLALVGDATEEDVLAARIVLEETGWDAQVFGAPVKEVLDQLARIARDALTSEDERDMLEPLANLWHEGKLPRDVELD